MVVLAGERFCCWRIFLSSRFRRSSHFSSLNFCSPVNELHTKASRLRDFQFHLIEPGSLTSKISTPGGPMHLQERIV